MNDALERGGAAEQKHITRTFFSVLSVFNDLGGALQATYAC